ncbi:hypothetical protein [Corynebacterium lowii]|uniref:hypothetical protein n=1 Tax=Corynebacterium lowii TaxID=1544413 RepID=UPI001B808C30|nr:hypothetical protein [Corynebacterium lowii]MDP9850729.1 hypothetical protein [Corynebacterium lowii]
MTLLHSAMPSKRLIPPRVEGSSPNVPHEARSAASCSDFCILEQISNLFLCPHSDRFVQILQMMGNRREDFSSDG